MGKEHDEWIKTRKAYLDAHPPNFEGYYVCYLCGIWVLEKEITVDHIIPRSRAPHLRHVWSNLALCCGSCNNAKGSKVVNVQDEDDREDTELEGLW